MVKVAIGIFCNVGCILVFTAFQQIELKYMTELDFSYNT